MGFPQGEAMRGVIKGTITAKLVNTGAIHEISS
jgi:hypothetical protein